MQEAEKKRAEATMQVTIWSDKVEAIDEGEEVRSS